MLTQKPRGCEIYHAKQLHNSLLRLADALNKHKFLWIKEAKEISSQRALDITRNTVYPMIEFSLHRATSRNKTTLPYTTQKLFKAGYINKKFICLNRTERVRLASQAIIKPEDFRLRHSLTSWLHSSFSDAETCAILWKLGERKFNPCTSKPSIQIDGVIKPSLTWQKRFQLSESEGKKNEETQA